MQSCKAHEAALQHTEELRLVLRAACREVEALQQQAELAAKGLEGPLVAALSAVRRDAERWRETAEAQMGAAQREEERQRRAVVQLRQRAVSNRSSAALALQQLAASPARQPASQQLLPAYLVQADADRAPEAVEPPHRAALYEQQTTQQQQTQQQPQTQQQASVPRSPSSRTSSDILASYRARQQQQQQCSAVAPPGDNVTAAAVAAEEAEAAATQGARSLSPGSSTGWAGIPTARAGRAAPGGATAARVSPGTAGAGSGGYVEGAGDEYYVSDFASDEDSKF